MMQPQYSVTPANTMPFNDRAQFMQMNTMASHHNMLPLEIQKQQSQLYQNYSHQLMFDNFKEIQAGSQIQRDIQTANYFQD